MSQSIAVEGVPEWPFQTTSLNVNFDPKAISFLAVLEHHPNCVTLENQVLLPVLL